MEMSKRSANDDDYVCIVMHESDPVEGPYIIGIYDNFESAFDSMLSEAESLADELNLWESLEFYHLAICFSDGTNKYKFFIDNLNRMNEPKFVPCKNQKFIDWKDGLRKRGLFD